MNDQLEKDTRADDWEGLPPDQGTIDAYIAAWHPKYEMVGSGALAANATIIAHAGAQLVGEGNAQVSVGRGHFVFVERNDDIGGGRPGKPTSRDLVRDKAEHLLKHGYSGTKKALGIDLSTWLARHHPDEPQMSAAVVERNITDIWQRYRGGGVEVDAIA